MYFCKLGVYSVLCGYKLVIEMFDGWWMWLNIQISDGVKFQYFL